MLHINEFVNQSSNEVQVTELGWGFILCLCGDDG